MSNTNAIGYVIRNNGVKGTGYHEWQEPVYGTPEPAARMTPSPDIIKDFARLQAECNELGKSNVALAQENARLRAALTYIGHGYTRDVDHIKEKVRETLFPAND